MVASFGVGLEARVGIDAQRWPGVWSQHMDREAGMVGGQAEETPECPRRLPIDREDGEPRVVPWQDMTQFGRATQGTERDQPERHRAKRHGVEGEGHRADASTGNRPVPERCRQPRERRVSCASIPFR